MKNYINIAISAKGSEYPQILIILDKYNDNSVFLKLTNVTEKRLEIAEYIENQHLLNIIDAFLAEAKKDEYNLNDSDYSELYINFTNIIFYYIFSAYFNFSVKYDEIKLININEY